MYKKNNFLIALLSVVISANAFGGGSGDLPAAPLCQKFESSSSNGLLDGEDNLLKKELSSSHSELNAEMQLEDFAEEASNPKSAENILSPDIQSFEVTGIKDAAALMGDLLKRHQRILFIFDVDGVLTNQSNPSGGEVKARGDIVRIVKLLAENNHPVVFSSAWNHFDDTIQKIRTLGLEQIAQLNDVSEAFAHDDLEIARNGRVISVKTSKNRFFRHKALAANYARDLGGFDAIVFMDDNQSNVNIFKTDIVSQDYAKGANVYTIKSSEINGEDNIDDYLHHIRLSAQTQKPELERFLPHLYLVDLDTNLKWRVDGTNVSGRITLRDDYMVFGNRLNLAMQYADPEDNGKFKDVILRRFKEESCVLNLYNETGLPMVSYRFNLLSGGNELGFRFSTEGGKYSKSKLEKTLDYVGLKLPPENCVYFDRGIIQEVEQQYRIGQFISGCTYVHQDIQDVHESVTLRISEYIVRTARKYKAKMTPNLVTKILINLRLHGWISQNQIHAQLEHLGF
jgi:hypothetical protein